MKRFFNFYFLPMVFCAGVFSAIGVIGNLDLGWFTLAVCLGVLIGAYDGALDDGWPLPRLVWQTPSMYRNAGLFLKIGDQRWRLFSVSSR